MRIGVYVGELAPLTHGGGGLFQRELLKELIRQNKDFELYVYYFGDIGDVPGGTNIRLVRLNKISMLADRFHTVRDLRFILTFGCKARYSFLNGIAKRDSIDLMYFPFPFSFAETEIPYLFTVWDLGGDVHPYFPELSMRYRNFEVRERLYRKALPKSMFVFIGKRKRIRKVVECTYGMYGQFSWLIALAQFLLKFKVKISPNFRSYRYLHRFV